MATPLVAEIGVVPESALPPGLVPMTTAMLALELVTVLPLASCTVTWIAGAMLAPAWALVGWTEKASLFAAPAVMLKVADVAPVRPADAAVSVYPVPTLSSERLEKVA